MFDEEIKTVDQIVKEIIDNDPIDEKKGPEFSKAEKVLSRLDNIISWIGAVPESISEDYSNQDRIRNSLTTLMAMATMAKDLFLSRKNKDIKYEDAGNEIIEASNQSIQIIFSKILKIAENENSDNNTTENFLLSMTTALNALENSIHKNELKEQMTNVLASINVILPKLSN